MRLITLSDVGFTWQKPALLDNIELAIDSGERIGLLGRNGCGKSTLMKMLGGELTPDHGIIRRDPKLKVSRLVQEVPQHVDGTIRQVILRGMELTGVSQNYHLPDEGAHAVNWQAEAALHRTLSQVNLEGDAHFGSLSAGLKRRVLLAQAIVQKPDLLLLDEPTNHLDIDSIVWLENFLRNYEGSLLFVTHDRHFLQHVATRILEIDRGRLFDWECDYVTFLERKAKVLAAEEKQEALFDKRLAAEEAWIRQGIKARRTRNEGRVRALEAMRQQRASRRQQVGTTKLQSLTSDRSGELVFELSRVGFSFDNRLIVDDFSTSIMRGDRVGIVGPNGAGKSTLLKLILGDLKPTSGSVRRGTKLEILYFDQLREQIDDEKSIAENVSPEGDELIIDGAQRHVLGYLQDFLFSPDRSRQLAKFLSGGERNRLLLARLFKTSSNVLVLDEPTNDLDTETLELLEERVSSFDGTLLLVSHDRTFLNNVVTSIIAVDGSGKVKEYEGGYHDYQRALETQQKVLLKQDYAAKDRTSKPATCNNSVSRTTRESNSTTSTSQGKLTFRERQELESLPAKIETLEQQQASLHQQMLEPSFFKQASEKIVAANRQLADIESELSSLFERWASLDARQ